MEGGPRAERSRARRAEGVPGLRARARAPGSPRRPGGRSRRPSSRRPPATGRAKPAAPRAGRRTGPGPSGRGRQSRRGRPRRGPARWRASSGVDGAWPGARGGSRAWSASRIATRRPGSSRSSRSRAARGSRASTAPVAWRRTRPRAASRRREPGAGPVEHGREGGDGTGIAPGRGRLDRPPGHGIVLVPHEVEDRREGRPVLDPVQHLERGETPRGRGAGEEGPQGLEDPRPEEPQAGHGGVALGRRVGGEPAQQLLYAPGTGWYDRHDDASPVPFSRARRARARPARLGRDGGPRGRAAHPALGQGPAGRGHGERRGPRDGADVPAVAPPRPRA